MHWIKSTSVVGVVISMVVKIHLATHWAVLVETELEIHVGIFVVPCH